MPHYKFKCENGHVFELFLTMSEYANLKEINCPICNEKSQRIYTPVNFKLEGIGWAEEGYQITEMEMQSNRDSDKFAEDEIRKKDKNIGF